MISIDSKTIPLNKALQWANHPMTRAMMGKIWPKLLTDLAVDYGLKPVHGGNRKPIACALEKDALHGPAVVESFPGRGAPKPLCLDCAIRHSDAFGPGDVVPLGSR